jgi:hypothetical protein
MTATDSNGSSLLRILVKGGVDARDCLLSREEGGSKLDRGLSHILVDRYGIGSMKVQVQFEERPAAAGYFEELVGGAGKAADAPNLVILSLHPDVLRPYDQGFGAAMTEVVRILKSRGCEVIFLNASTIDPSDFATNYAGLTDEPFSMVAQRLDLDLLRLSVSEDVSIVDADRILAELGASALVVGPTDYLVDACAAVCAETARVIDDIGFLDKILLDHNPEGGRDWIRLELPFLVSGAEEVIVTKWHKSVGEIVESGDPLCDVTVRSGRAMVRVNAASKLLEGDRSTGRRPNMRTVRLKVGFRLTSAESIQLSEVIAEDGQAIGKDRLLAIGTSRVGSVTDRPKPLSSERLTLPLMRVKVRALDPSEKEDEEDRQ